MKYLSVTEVAEKWGVSPTMVRRYCVEERILDAKQEEGVWLIPLDAAKPGRKPKMKTEQPALTAFAKRIVYQRNKNNHFGIYEYIQVNLTYSSNRMASNRLTRGEVEEIYRTNKITSSFEPVKVDDIIETINHFFAVRYVVDHIMTPLSQSFIKKLHYILTYGTYVDRKEKISSDEYRICASDIGVPPKEIHTALVTLIKDYENDSVDMERVLDFHVHFEQIHPFKDYNGRVGRLIMLKECLRHGVTPFIIDDKRRSRYFRGIQQWHDDSHELTDVAMEAQDRFEAQIELLKLCTASRLSIN